MYKKNNLISAIIILIVLTIISIPFLFMGTGLVANKEMKYSVSDIPKCVESSLDIGKECPIAVSNSRRVVLIAVDALGWSTLQYAKEQNIGKWINRLSERVYKAETTYPSTTRVAFPEMLPDAMFDSMKKNNLTYACVASEGFFNWTDICAGSRIYATNRDGDRFTGDDDDVSLEAINALKDDYDFMFIHLSVDSTCHKHGPYSDESMNDLYSTDDDIGKIFRALNTTYGNTTIIITADHGCHPTKSGGSHGTRRAEDMEIPIILYTIE